MPSYSEFSTLLSISPGIYHKQALSASSRSPKTTVFILSWMGTPDRAVAKYVDGYSAQYPQADLYLITSTVQEWTFGSYTKQRQSLAAALVPILKQLKPEDIIFSIFSNGGTQKFSLLAEVYKKQTNNPMPARAIILDSCPGKSDFERGVPALAAGIPRHPLISYPVKAAIYILIAAGLSFYWVTGTEEPNSRGGRILNDPEIIDVQAPRVYVFSKDDGIVGCKDIVKHASEAKERGIKVSLEEFQGSQHSAHMRVDPDRYWRIVKGL